MPELASNKKGLRGYEILEVVEAGIVLRGNEVKAVRAGKMQLAGSHVKIVESSAVLVGSTIALWSS